MFLYLVSLFSSQSFHSVQESCKKMTRTMAFGFWIIYGRNSLLPAEASNILLTYKTMFPRTLLLLLSLILFKTTHAQLHLDYYRNSCPDVESIVRSAVQEKFQQTFVTAPATLRLFFHDCLVRVCCLFSLKLTVAFTSVNQVCNVNNEVNLLYVYVCM